jgi:hypothetical protein
MVRCAFWIYWGEKRGVVATKAIENGRGLLADCQQVYSPGKTTHPHSNTGTFHSMYHIDRFRINTMALDGWSKASSMGKPSAPSA